MTVMNGACRWTLHYYTRGCPSWGWFFPYHYGPFISDLVGARRTSSSSWHAIRQACGTD